LQLKTFKGQHSQPIDSVSADGEARDVACWQSQLKYWKAPLLLKPMPLSSILAYTQLAALFLLMAVNVSSAVVSGRVTRDSIPVSRARITLTNARIFLETRTSGTGGYSLAVSAEGVYQLGISAPGLEYQETAIYVSSADLVQDFRLSPQVHPGHWTVAGDTDPESFGGTNSGIVLPDGRVMYCHDTIDPVIFDPSERSKKFPKQPSDLEHSSDGQQGCHNLTHLEDGRILYVGGGTLDAQGNFTDGQKAIRVVKAFDPVAERWEVLSPLNEVRWYPGLVRLADGDLLAFGGGQQPLRAPTASSEIFDRRSRLWRMTGPMTSPGGFGPATLLYNGDVFLSWYPAQIYSVSSGRWRNTRNNFLQPNRGEPGAPPSGGSGRPPNPGEHPDHSIVVLPDGRVATIGIWGAAMGSPGSMVEIFDPATESWSLGANPPTIRAFAEVLQLPDGRVLVAGGQPQAGPPVFVNHYGYTNAAELYDPARDTWRSVAPMKWGREYHAITTLLPDGRVLVQAGTSAVGVNPSHPQFTFSNEIEVYSPPYLFRGPRPVINSISATELTRGGSVTVDVSRTNEVTGVRLMGLSAVTHFLDAGIQRALDLPFTQSGSTVSVRLPANPNVLLAGYYILFAMVDDIPSAGRVVRVLPAPAGPSFTSGGVVNAASFRAGSLSPGEIITIFGSGLGPDQPVGLQLNNLGVVDTELASVRVRIGGLPAPLLYVSARQVTAVAPYALAGRQTAEVQIEYRGERSPAVVMPVSEASPAIFTANSSGAGQAAALNEDGTLNSPSNPAPRGSIVTLFATGEGQTVPNGIDGNPAAPPLSAPVLPVTVVTRDVNAEILYAGGAPALVAGVMQLNLRVPWDIEPGDTIPLVLRIGDRNSPAVVTIAVK
jgi:uncharacterized protein (TIGR03437 family)